MTKPDRNPPVKHCPSCYICHYAAVRVCNSCGFEFYPKRVKPIDLPPTGVLTGGFGGK